MDDNNGIRATLKLLLTKYFKEVRLVSTPNVINEELRNFAPDVVLLDMNFVSSANTGNEGLFWLSEIKKSKPETEVVLFTAYADISLAVEGMKRGAFDFVVKPWDNDKFIETLNGAYARKCDGQDKAKVKQAEQTAVEMYWGCSPAMESIHRMIEKIAPTDASVLITGENGTGKDVLAGEIHRMSERADKPMVCVDAGAITETLFESELFGHVKGAFTDAYTVEQDSLNLRKYVVRPASKLLPGYEYFLKIPHRKFMDINGFLNDSSEVKVMLPNDDKLSSLTLSLGNVHNKYIVDMLNEKRDQTIRSFTVDSDTTLLFPYITAGKYSIRLTEDINRNGLVDTGNLLEHKQPEKVKFYRLENGDMFIDIPEMTELEQGIDVGELFR